MSTRLSRPAMQARIRDAARPLLAERGYDATTLADILTAAGKSNGSFFHAFAGKLEVARAVGEEAMQSHQAAVLPAFEAHTDPAATVGLVVRAELAWFEAHPDRGRMLIELPACLRGHEGDRLAAAQDPLLAALRRWVARLPPGTAATPLAPVIAAVVFGPARALCTAWLEQPAGERPSTHVDSLAAAVCAALQLSQPTPRSSRQNRPGQTARQDTLLD